MKKLELDVALILPKEASACSACIARILKALKHRPGISDVHVDTAESETPKLCLHYDPNIIHSDVLRRLVENAGGVLGRQFEHLGVLHPAGAFGARRV